MSSESTTHLACEIVEGFEDPQQKVEHEAGLGIQIDDDLEVTKLGNGQCKHRGVKVGDKLLGMNGIPMADCVKQALGDEEGAVLNAKTAGKVLIATPKPYTLNFNGMPDKMEVKQEMDKTFMALLKQGIEVDKKHRHGNIFNRMAKRIVYMNQDSDTIFVGKTKTTPTEKIFKVSEVANVGYSQKSPDQVVIQTKDQNKDLTVKLPSAKANETFAHKLFTHLSLHKEKSVAGDGPLSPRMFRNGSGITAASP